jgi:hypothetical protein
MTALDPFTVAYEENRKKEQVTALTREELLDIDPIGDTRDKAHIIALRHAWNWAVEAEHCLETDPNRYDCAAVSQAWSAIAEALK